MNSKSLIYCFFIFSLLWTGLLGVHPLLLINSHSNSIRISDYFTSSSINATVVNETLKIYWTYNYTDSNRMYVMGVLTRVLLINDTYITISGYTANINWTWKDAENRTRRFDAIWVHTISDDDNLPIRKDKYTYPHLTTFLSDYNGTHFSELIINGSAGGFEAGSKAFGTTNLTFKYMQRPESVNYEQNRTEIYGNSTDSQYNPARALLVVHNYLANLNLTYDNVTTIYLIPKAYLIENYSNHEFVWFIVLLKDISDLEKAPDTIMYYQFILSPDCDILNATILKLFKLQESACADDDTSYYGDIQYIAIGASIMTLVILSIYIAIKKRKISR